jgi:hypothetical protein
VTPGTNAIGDACEELTRTLRLPVRPLGTAPEDFRNLHLVAGAEVEPTMFIKLVEKRAFHEAAFAVSPVFPQIGIQTPSLLDHGILTDGRAWLAYTWHEFTEFESAPSLVERAGALLGQLHANSTGLAPMGLAAAGTTLTDDLRERADQLAGFAPEYGRRVRRLIPHCVEVPRTDHCVLHGDFGWRNLGLDASGQVWLLDWDTATWGHPAVDLGKLIDREFTEDHVRDLFLRGYRQHHPVINYPWPAYVDTVRLWVAAGLLNYALLRGLAGLTGHALHILEEIESRCG